MQLMRMALIALLAGMFTMVLVWLAWDVPARLRATAGGWLAAWKRRREARGLLAQAKEPNPEERPE